MRRFLSVLIVLGVVASGCGGEETASVECPPGEALAGFEGDECVPLDVSGSSEAEATTTSTTTSTTSSTTTTTAAPESSTTTTESSAVDQLQTTPAVTDGEIPEQLTWAEEGTTEADIERAFWVANTSRREAVEARDQDTNEDFLDSHTGDELARLLEAQRLDIDEGVTYRYPESSDTLIETIVLVTPTEALMQVCEQDRAEFFINGELTDDADYDSQFQARFILGDDGVWRWEERIRITFEALEDGQIATCLNGS